jgi:hypothetical protein
MTVRAKFYVTSIQHHHTQSPGYVCAEIKLAPVYGDENKPWSQATPQGQIAMTITNPDAIDAFELGKFYFVDFTPAPEPEKPAT